MKKIVPFNNVLTFNTDVKEITAISLEHKIDTNEDSISGTFYITGEYKIIDGQIEPEPFSFELPFDIALGSNYKLETLEIDIDDFRYEQIDNNKLKVNIDLYIDGEILDDNPEEELFTEKELRILKKDTEEKSTPEPVTNTIEPTEPILTKIQERLDLLDEMINKTKKEEIELIDKDNKKEQENNKDNIDININNTNTLFNNLNDEETYSTYRVYTMSENDTLDTVIEKYHISKEELSNYNSLEDIHPGTKLIIPSIENKNDK